MVNLAIRSVIVLALLFGLVFAVGIMALLATGLPVWLAVPFAVIVLALQYALGPFILQWIFKIQWTDPAQFNPQLAAFIARTCQERNIPQPRFGVIDDGNPNAFTFGTIRAMRDWSSRADCCKCSTLKRCRRSWATRWATSRTGILW